ncbi:MAG: tryptophan synthase subunit alpha [Clostridiaceae bacterium]|jgi:tryptophan synthase alpha chain|nr:tryptophan synthase subunit alpha [Clostridiaceae bacterium]
MSRLKEVFSAGKAFIPFITAGDPSLEITEQLVYKMAEAGADLIELGIPFSDPVAEGPVIQAADRRALEAGTTTDGIFEMMRRIRRSCDIPIAFMTYMNPVFSYGTDRFMSNCKACGVDAVIVPDLPFEERNELLPFCDKHRVVFVSMIAPTSGERIRMIADKAEGFVYCVSSTGVTGVRHEICSDAEVMISSIKRVKNIPCAVGFGISTPEQAAQVAEYADGVIIGSAIVDIAARYGSECIPHIEEFTRAIKKAISNK